MVASVVPLRSAAVGAYYVSAVGHDRLHARTGEELAQTVGYYDGHGEAPGRWLGRGAAGLGLPVDGQVDADAFRQLLEGIDPHTGEKLRADADAFYMNNKNLRPGWDMTFSPPKSVSAVWALGDRSLAHQVERAHREAVDRAMRYIEDEAARVRRGAGGTLQYAAEGVIAAGFQHRTSRASDPQLHEHVVMIALAKGPDGRYTTLESKEIYGHFMTAGAVYHAALREGLTARLGVRWTPRDATGLAEIAGVDEELMRAWSKRRSAIEAEVLATGHDLDNAAHCEAATLSTRAGKEGGKTTAELREGWDAEAAELGYPWEQVWAQIATPRLTGPELATHRHAAAVAAALAGGAWSREAVTQQLAERGVNATEMDEVLGRVMESPLCPQTDRDRFALDWLTVNRSTFNRRLLIQALARLDGTAGDLEARADALLRTEGAVLLRSEAEKAVGLDRDLHGVGANGRTFRAREQGTYTTPDVLAAEQRILDLAIAGRGAGVAVVAQEHVDRELSARPTIEADQRDAVLHITTSGHTVTTVRGSAGAGKTYGLDAARAILEAAGHTVIGCAPSGKAALELQAGAGIASSTIDSLLLSLERAEDPVELAEGAVIVVDEAGMVGTRKLDRLAAHVARTSGAKLVLVGDDKQLLSVEAGGMFRELVEAHPDLVTEMHTNRRAKQLWERKAQARLRVASPEQAEAIVREYVRHGRVIGGEDRDQVVARMASDFWDAKERQIGTGDTARAATAVLLANTRADVDALNEAAIREGAERGHLTGETHQVGDRHWLHGQAVLATQNALTKHGVLNGQTGIVVGAETRGVRWAVTVELPAQVQHRKRLEWDADRPLPTPGEVIAVGADRAHVVTVRSRRDAHGAVTGHEVIAEMRTRTFESERQPQPGDALQLGRGTKKLTATVATVVPVAEQAHLAVQIDDGELVHLPADYVREHLTDGYAMTVHRSQGRTVDAALTFGAGMDRNALYVAMTRARGTGDGDAVTAAANRVQELRAATETGDPGAIGALEQAQEHLEALRQHMAARDRDVVNNRLYVVGDEALLAGLTSREETIARLTDELQIARGIVATDGRSEAEEDRLRVEHAAARVADLEAQLHELGVSGDGTPARAEGAFIRRGRLVAAESRETVLASMAADLWDRIDPTDPRLAQARTELAEAEQRAQDALLDPAGDLAAEAAALRTVEELRDRVRDLEEGTQAVEAGAAVMVAQRRSDVDALNAAAIAEGIRRGVLSERDTVVHAQRAWHVGQAVAVTAADTRRGLAAGQLAHVIGAVEEPVQWTATLEFKNGRSRTVTSKTELVDGQEHAVRGMDGLIRDAQVTRTEPRLQLQLADGDVVEVSEKYAARALVDGYALTAARARAVDEDAPRLLLAAGMEPEARAALSAQEGREAATRVYMVGDAGELVLTDAERAERALVDELSRQVGRSRGELAASGELRARGELPQLAELQEERRYLAGTLAAAPQGAAPARQAAAARLVRVQQARADQVDRVAQRASAGNPDPAGETLIARYDGEIAELRSQLRELQSTPEKPCPLDAERAEWLATHRADVERFQELTGTLDKAAALTVASYELEGPGYLPARPETPLEREQWRARVLHVEAYRTRWGVQDPADALGPEPRSVLQRREWVQAVDALEAGTPRAEQAQDLGRAASLTR